MAIQVKIVRDPKVPEHTSELVDEKLGYPEGLVKSALWVARAVAATELVIIHHWSSRHSCEAIKSWSEINMRDPRAPV
jgi:hypothetical protein